MSQEHRAESRKVYDVDRRTHDIERRLNRMCNSFTTVGLFLAFGSFSYDFIAPLFQVRIAEGMGWMQIGVLCIGLTMTYIGLISRGKT